MRPDLSASLAEQRCEVIGRVEVLQREYADLVAASADANTDDEHDPEGATIAFERAQLGALVDQARQRRDELDHAIDRVTRGDYGLCERCGRSIAAERLTARPSAQTCITCARASMRAARAGSRR